MRDLDERWFTCVHEAGHAAVAFALGLEVQKILVYDEPIVQDDPNDPEMEITFLGKATYAVPKAHCKQYAYFAYPCLGGYYATAVLCPSAPSDWQAWKHLTDDLADFNRFKQGASKRHARKICLEVVQDMREWILAEAGKLYRFGRVDEETQDW